MREDDTIIEYKGEIISEAEIDRRYPEDMEGLNHTFVFGVEHDYNIDGGVNGNAARWFNHASPIATPSRKTGASSSAPLATSGRGKS